MTKKSTPEQETSEANWPTIEFTRIHNILSTSNLKGQNLQRRESRYVLYVQTPCPCLSALRVSQYYCASIPILLRITYQSY